MAVKMTRTVTKARAEKARCPSLLSYLIIGTIFTIIHSIIITIPTSNAESTTTLPSRNIINRQLSASISSSTWPTTPTSPLCEAYSFLDSPPTSPLSDYSNDAEEYYLLWKQRYLAFLSSSILSSEAEADADAGFSHFNSYEDGIQQALDLAIQSMPSSDSDSNSNNASLDIDLIRFSLATRAHSPQCEMYRTLSNHAMTAALGSAGDDFVHIPAFVVTAPPPNTKSDTDPDPDVVMDHSYYKIYTSVEDLVSKTSGLMGEHQNQNKHWTDDAWANLLPKERIFHYSSSDGGENGVDDSNGDGNLLPIHILYGQFHTKEFASFYTYLNEQKYPFVVRYMNMSIGSKLNSDIDGTNNTRDSDNENDNGNDTVVAATKTVLQGYGVRVDIRNLEYKSFDEKESTTSTSSSSSSNTKETEKNIDKVSLNIDALKEDWRHGIDPEFLKAHSSNEQMQTFIKEYLPHFLSSSSSSSTSTHESDTLKDKNYHLPIIPPKSELENICLAATSIIHQSKDPLWTLIQLSQNLPSHAYDLSNVTIPPSLQHDAEYYLSSIPDVMEARYRDTGMFQFYVNGRRIHVERPSFNLFELMNILREEDGFLKNIQSVMKDYLDTSDPFGGSVGSTGSRKGMDVVTSLLSMGKTSFDALAISINTDSDGNDNDDDGDYEDEDEKKAMLEAMGMKQETKLRIDVGRGYKGAILYLNDIEKDKEYSNWPRDVQRVLMSMQFGGPPTLRRNMITTLLVVDPFSPDVEGILGIISLLFQYIQGMYPIRVGVLLVNENDVDYCRQSLRSGENDENEYCLKKQYQGNDDDISSQTASAHTISTFLNHIHENYGSGPAINYLYGFLKMQLESGKKEVSIAELLMIHEKLLMSMSIPSDGTSILLKELTRSESSETKSLTYEKAVRFAITKNIKPGMGFVNGIPFPASDPRKMQSVIQDEFSHLLGMILTEQITNGRQSVYAKVLTGPNVYSSMHPLLDKSKPEYLLVSSYFDHEAVVALSPDAHGTKPKFLIDAIVDFTTDEGIQFAESFLSSLLEKNKTDSSKKASDISFRVLPSDKFSAETFLGKIFLNGKQFGITNLLEIVREVKNTQFDEKDITNIVPQIDRHLKDLMEKLLNDKSYSQCSTLPWTKERSGSISVNGRTYRAQDIGIQDIDILLDLEHNSAEIITNQLSPFVGEQTNAFVAIARFASFLGRTYSASKSNGITRADPLAPYRDIIELQSLNEKNWFYYAWNNGNDEGNDDIKVTVTAILDPLAEATQRAGPIIRTLRDDFNLPIQLILVPRLQITEDSTLPVTTYYRFVADSLDALNDSNFPKASFQGLPVNQVLTIRMDVPEPWDVQQGNVVQDTDNLRCDDNSCGDDAYAATRKVNATGKGSNDAQSYQHLTEVEYNLNSLLFFGQCYDVSDKTPPNGLQFTLSEMISSQKHPSSGTLVMKTVGYWQLQSKPGVWQLQIADNTRGSEIYEIVEGELEGEGFEISDNRASIKRTLLMKDFVNRMEVVLVRRRPGQEEAELLTEESIQTAHHDDTIHVFSLATGHLYERFMKIMMLSVTKRASTNVKFWLFENFLSPSFKSSAFAMAKRIGCEVEFITYKWPEWLRGQKEKQRIIWGYKILFLDVLFPLNLKKVIYVDADQVVRGDLKELMELDLEGAPYGYTPMCESREETKGYQFWRDGFWPAHLRGKPYHISALYVVDLQRFRRELVGDQLRAVYQQLTADPNNLSNLDQDLPNYTQHQIKIHSLPQDWLWCESWCNEETKATAKTIDLCNNPAHKEAKLSMAKRVISGNLFEESWVELDEEVHMYDEQYFSSLPE